MKYLSGNSTIEIECCLNKIKENMDKKSNQSDFYR